MSKYQEKDFEIRSVNYENIDEITKIALIHEEMPLLWNSDYIVSEEELNDGINKISSHSGDSDFTYLIALNSQNEIIATEWGEIKIIHEERAVYVSSIWVDEKYRGSNIAKKLNRKIEEWAKQQKAKFISIDVHFNNKRMIKLAQLFGFKPRFVEMTMILEE